MYIVFFVAGLLTIERWAAGPWSLVTFALLFLIVAACVKAHQSPGIPIDTEDVRIDPEAPGIPQEVSEYYRHTVARLTPLGFKPVLSFKTKPVPNAIGFSTVFKNHRTSEVATIVNSSIVNSLVSSGVTSSVLFFRTEFADGTNVMTHNNNFPSHFPPQGPPEHVFAFPQVRDPARLYEVHQAVVGQFDKDSLHRDAIGDDPDGYLKRSGQRLHVHFVACGYYYLDEAKGVLRLTWKGAFMGTLKLFWPVRQIRKVWRWSKAARMLHELNLQ
jgi:hypothetical protein